MLLLKKGWTGKQIRLTLNDDGDVNAPGDPFSGGKPLFPSSANLIVPPSEQATATALYDDPSGTSDLANELMLDVNSAFARIMDDVNAWLMSDGRIAANELIVNDLDPVAQAQGRLKRFRAWLRDRMGSSLVGDALLERYIGEGYRRGQRRAYRQLVGKEEVTGTEGRRIGDRGLATVQKIKLLASRAFIELEDVNVRMGTLMSRILIEGLVAGQSYLSIADRMVREVGIERQRAETIVRTELVRAHAEGQLDEMSATAKDTKVQAMVEGQIANDGRTCAKCAPLARLTLTLEEARGIIPVHPNCRCAWIPVVPSPTSNAGATVPQPVDTARRDRRAHLPPRIIRRGHRKALAGPWYGTLGEPVRTAARIAAEPVLNTVVHKLPPLQTTQLPDLPSNEIMVFSELLFNMGQYKEELHPRARDGKFAKKGGKTVKELAGKPKFPPPSTDDKSKFIGEKVGKAEHVRSGEVEAMVAKGVGGKVASLEGGVYAPRDVQAGSHALEVKSLLKGSKTSISVHDDALLRKVDWMAANHGATYHTVVWDDRGTYEGGNHKDKFSGHQLYYRRGNGRWSLSSMHKVKDMDELKRLIHSDEASLPDKAKGSLPTDPAVIGALRTKAAKAHAARLSKDRARKQRLKAARLAAKK